MDKKKAFRIAVVLFGTALCALFVFLLLPRMIVWFLPFILAYLLTKLIEPFVHFLCEKCKIPRSIGSIFCIVLAIGLLGGIITAVVSRLWDEANDILTRSDVIIENIAARFEAFRDSFASRLGLADELGNIFNGFSEKLSEYAASYTGPAIRGAFDMVKSVPSGIIFTVVFVMASYFMSSDRERIAAGLHRFLPEKIMGFANSLSKNVFSALAAYIRAQLVLICITFFELTIGFLIIGGSVADYALLLALIISIIDAIPILGTGTVLIPWGVFSLISGDIRIGVMLIVLYLICLCVRQLVEPRLVAHQIGIHPLMILMVMYIGLRLFGLFGMILGPILALIVKQLYIGGLFSSIGQYIHGDTPADKNP